MREGIKLETTALKLENLERVHPEQFKKNPLLQDMKWLVQELRKAWIELEAKNGP